MKISKEEIKKIIKEEIDKTIVNSIIKEGFNALDAAAAPEVKEKLAEYGLDVGSYSDKEIANMLMEFIYSFGTRVVSVEDTIRMIDSRYGPDGEFRLNKPKDRPTPEKDMTRSKTPLVTVSDRRPSSDYYDGDGPEFEKYRERGKQIKRDRYWDDIERQRRRRGY